jgi:SAM-dependent methyltransferase
MNLSDDRRNPFLIAYSLVRRTGFLQTALGRRIFKSAYFLYKRYVEDDLRDLLRAYPAIVGGGNVLDIGANIGYTAAVLARATASGRKVYAFEPEPFNYRLLEQTALQPEFARTGPLNSGSTIVITPITASPRNSFAPRILNPTKSASLWLVSTAFFRAIRDRSLLSKSTFKAMNSQSARA